MNKEMKRWVGAHRRGLRKAWNQERQVREVSWQAFCAEMYNIWTELSRCRPEEANYEAA